MTRQFPPDAGQHDDGEKRSVMLHEKSRPKYIHSERGIDRRGDEGFGSVHKDQLNQKEEARMTSL